MLDHLVAKPFQICPEGALHRSRNCHCDSFSDLKFTSTRKWKNAYCKMCIFMKLWNLHKMFVHSVLCEYDHGTDYRQVNA